jgi:hypothetical protein
MRIAEIIVEEGRQPVMMFHGTSSALLRSILSNGIMPNPPGKTWAADPHASVYSPSRASLEGSYWTTNLMTSLSSAWNTCKKFGGDRMIVCALIQEQSAFADEDSINTKISFAFNDTMAAIQPGVRPDAIAIHLYSFIHKPDMLTRAIELFKQNLHKVLAGGAKMPIDPRMSQKLFNDYFMRKAAHEIHNDKYYLTRFFQSGEELPHIPTVDEAENAFHEDLEWVTRRYRATAFSSNETFNHTLRITQSVGFRGANRITCIIAEQMDQNRNRSLRLLYGQPPAELIQAWQQSVGEWKAPVSGSPVAASPVSPPARSGAGGSVSPSGDVAVPNIPSDF